MISAVLMAVAFTVIALASGVPWWFSPVTGVVTTGILHLFFWHETIKHGGEDGD